VSIRSLLEYVGIDVGDVIYIDGVALDEEPDTDAPEFDCS
jgi:hypothetical protein